MSDDPYPSTDGEVFAALEPSKPASTGAAMQAEQLRQELVDLLQAARVDRKLARAKGRQLLRDTQALFQQVRLAVDHREVAGGLVGLTAGEVLGGAVGAAAGAMVGGPLGAVVGAEVGAFAAGTLGLKFGTEAVRDFVEDATPAPDAGSPEEGAVPAAVYLRRPSTGKYGRTLGFAAGGSAGRIIAGRRGGFVGELLGEATGGRVDAAGAPRATRDKPGLWLDRVGMNLIGESATALVGGTVGSVFGPGGRLLGRRLGTIIGLQVAWHRLIEPADEVPRVVVPLPLPSTNAMPGSSGSLSEPDPAGAAMGETTATPDELPQAPSADPAGRPVDFLCRDEDILLFLARALPQNASAAPIAVLPAMPTPGALSAGQYWRSILY